MKGPAVLEALLPSRIRIISATVCFGLLCDLVTLTTVYAEEQLKADLTATADSAAPSSGDRDVMFHRIKANKVLFLGNSITTHGPAPAIGWLGNWGMAASTKDNDYVHLVLKAISAAAEKDPASVVTNIADFERQFETYDIDFGLKRELAFKADLVIVAIGENVPALTSEQAKAAFKANVTKLLKRLKENSEPVIVVRSCFWQDQAKDTILKQACGEVGGIFVDAGTLGKDEANYARSEREFSHDGVAGHPGDKGMHALADAILKGLRQRQ
ncbi:MAG: SGNH/GDSL hydrolase family protein [Planctomycetes bacterium]|nr:SGNH/GDSL hydrolase family protein [Planctomycetota bacterium]